MNNISKYIDHTILKATADQNAIKHLCEEAITYNFTAVCVPPHYVAFAKSILREYSVKIATVIGFPLGYDATETKLTSIYAAIKNGADEIDLVQNLCALKNKDWAYLRNEIAESLQPIRLHNKTLKIILETSELTNEEIIKCCEIYTKHKVDFVKTSTGFSAKGGADIEVVKLLRQHLPESIAIKAAGGIRTYTDAEAYINAGADRIGTSSGVEIFKESKR